MPLARSSSLAPAAATLIWQARFRTRPYVLDGATGAELERRGVRTDGPLWASAALRSDPQTVTEIHAQYIAAGADIITTNTFRLSPAAIGADRRRRRLRVSARLVEADRARLQRRAVQLVHDSMQRPPRRPIVIAGGLGPCADCYRPDLVPSAGVLRREYGRRARTLTSASVDLLWFETLGTLPEAAVAASQAWTVRQPSVVAVMLREDGELLGGGTLAEFVAAVAPYHPAALGLNCIPPRAISTHLPRLRALTELPIVVYGHVNNAAPLPGWSYAERAAPAAYAEYAQRWVRDGANIVGGCCGTTPGHIRAVARALRAVAIRRAARRRAGARPLAGPARFG